MVKTLASILRPIDRIFPRTRVEGREGPEAYSEWEYNLGKGLLTDHAEHFGDLQGKQILDAGCGLGGKTIAYAERGAEMFGIDINPQHIAWAKEYAAKQGRADNFSVGDAENLQFPDAHFDMVVANDSMEHFPHPDIALREFERVLKPGGTLFLFFTPWGSPLGSHLYDWIKTPWCHLLFPESLLEEMIRRELSSRGHEDPAGEAAKQMESYRTTINRITVRSYHRMLKSFPDLEVIHEDLNSVKFRSLDRICGVWLIGELFTNTVISFLRKRA